MKPRTAILLFLLLAVLLFAVRVAYLYNPDLLLDDAFISFRYAANFANGLGLVFNSGERVEGYTNFLWTLLLGVGARFGINSPILSQLMGIVSASGVLAVMAAFARRWVVGREQFLLLAGLPMLIFACLGATARLALSGMETLLFTFLAVLAVYFLLFNHRIWLAGMLFALTAMTRPEGLLIFGLALIYTLIFPSEFAQATRPAPRSLLILELVAGFCLLYLPYFAWRWAYYGYLLPNTFYAKAAGFNLERIDRGWRILGDLMDWWQVWPLLLLGVAGLAPVKANALPEALISSRDHVWALFAAIVLTVFIYFIFVGGDFIIWFGPRFLMLAMPFLLWLASQGIANLLSFAFLPDTAVRQLQWLYPTEWLVCLTLVIYLVIFSWPARWTRLESFGWQMRSWKELGLWMKTNLPSGTLIAVDAAGLIPYYSGLHTIDMYGLADVHIAHLNLTDPGSGIVAHEKFDPAYVLGRHPDCIVSTFIDQAGRPLSAGLPALQPAFDNAYKLIAVAKSRGTPPPDGRWVLPVDSFNAGLFQQGYQSGLFCVE